MADPPPTDPLLERVVDRMHGVRDEQARWELLLEAVVAMSADLSLDGLLERMVATACRLAGARYGALGVVDPHERRLATFVDHGMPAQTSRALGHLPEGRGILGLLIEHPEPLRLHDLTEHPDAYGFPPGHPAMHSFLGVPVRTRDTVFGNLYLTEKEDGHDFSTADERIVVALASAAGVAVENARLYADVRRRERWLAATADITGPVVAAVDTEQALALVVDRAREVAQADAAWVFQPGSGRRAVSPQGDAAPAGPGVTNLVDAVCAAGVPQVATTQQALLLGVPFGFDPEQPAALVLAWTGPATPGHVETSLPAAYAEQAALSVQVARSQQDRQRLAVYQDRDRIGRDLHDLVIQRLFAVGLSLEGSGRMTDAPDLRRRLESAVDDLDGTIRDIRATIFELGSPEESADLRAEMSRLVARAAATLKFRPHLQVTGPVNTVVGADLAADLLAVLSESLSNATRHAEATGVDVTVSVDDEELVLEVVDDGRGIPEGAAESGLRNMRERARHRGGSCETSSAPGGGTRVRWSVPLR